MTEPEIEEWLGYRPGELAGHKVRLKRAVVDGMKDVPVPAPRADMAQVAVFRVFLSCAGKPGDVIVEPIPKEER